MLPEGAQVTSMEMGPPGHPKHCTEVEGAHGMRKGRAFAGEDSGCGRTVDRKGSLPSTL